MLAAQISQMVGAGPLVTTSAGAGSCWLGLEDLWVSLSNCESSVNEMGPKTGLHELCE